MKPSPCFVTKSVWRVLSIRDVLPNALLILILLQGYFAYPGPPATRKLPLPFQMDPYPSTYQPLPRKDTLIRNATILDGAGRRMDGASLLLHSGKVAAIGQNLAAGNAVVIDAGGRWITPGLIDVHTHDGDDSAPLTRGTADVNEDTDPNTANVWAEHSVNTQDPSFARALAAGVTTMNILPGSDNIFGGRTVVVKSIPAVTVQDMKFPKAPYSLKMACGESPREAYGSKGRFPSTRMGEVAAEREAFLRAADYLEKWLAYERGDASSPPARDLRMDTLAGVLHGDILVQMHCYTAADMGVQLGVALEFGFHIAAFHHASEAYKIADLLAASHVCVAAWPDYWGFKMESYDGIPENAAFVDAAGGCATMHSDLRVRQVHLNTEMARAMAAGLHAGLKITREQAIRWVTSNAAKALGLEDRIGSLEVGKNADVVIWSADPFSVYAKVDQVFIDGALAFDRADPKYQPRSDFELGQPAQGPVR